MGTRWHSVRCGTRKMSDSTREVIESARDVFTHLMGGTGKGPFAIGEIRDALQALLDTGLEADTERLDWLQSQTKGYGYGWVCRDSATGRGMRLHETLLPGAVSDVREAIDLLRGKDE